MDATAKEMCGGSLHYRRGQPRNRRVLGLLVLVPLVTSAWHVARLAPAAVSPSGAVGVVRTDSGLRFVLSVPRGPYFQSELLPVTLVLTNDSGQAMRYIGALPPRLCTPPALSVSMTSGGQLLLPLAADRVLPKCPAPLRRLHGVWVIGPFPTVLLPDRSLRSRVLLGLPASGNITLTGEANFLPTKQALMGSVPPSHKSDGRLEGLRRFVPGLSQSGHTPFVAGGPSLTIQAFPTVPARRALRLVWRGHEVLIRGDSYAHGEPVALPPLVVEYFEVFEGTFTCPEGVPDWTPLVGSALHDFSRTSPGCSSSPQHEKWQVLAGAEGYGIASAVYCFNPTPAMIGPASFGPPCTELLRG